MSTPRAIPENPYHSRPRPEPNPAIEGKLEPSKHGSRLFFWSWWGSTRVTFQSHGLCPNSTGLWMWPLIHLCYLIKVHLCWWGLKVDFGQSSCPNSVSSSGTEPILPVRWRKDGWMIVSEKAMNPFSLPDHICKCNEWTNATCCYCCQLIKEINYITGFYASSFLFFLRCCH